MQTKSWRTRLLQAVAVMLAFSLVAACGTSNKGQGTNTDGTKDDSNEIVTLRMIESLTSPNRTELIKASVDKFMAQNPNIKVFIGLDDSQILIG